MIPHPHIALPARIIQHDFGIFPLPTGWIYQPNGSWHLLRHDEGIYKSMSLIANLQSINRRTPSPAEGHVFGFSTNLSTSCLPELFSNCECSSWHLPTSVAVMSTARKDWEVIMQCTEHSLKLNKRLFEKLNRIRMWLRCTKLRDQNCFWFNFTEVRSKTSDVLAMFLYLGSPQGQCRHFFTALLHYTNFSRFLILVQLVPVTRTVTLIPTLGSHSVQASPGVWPQI